MVAAPDLLARALDRDRLLGDEDHVGPAGDPAHHGDPAHVPAHHLQHHDAVVGLGGRVQPVDRLRRDRDRRVEPERVVGCGQVVVDRLRDADDGEVVLPVAGALRRRACLRRRRRPGRRTPRSRSRSTASTPPSILYGFVLVVPRIVPPRGRRPEISRGPSGSKIPSTRPRQPSRMPTISHPGPSSGARRRG